MIMIFISCTAPSVGGGGGSKSLRISFLEAVYGFRVSFLSLCIFLEFKFNVMAVSGAVNAFHY